MMPKLSVRQQIEKNGLLLIAVMMVGIYWAFDYVSSGHYLTRTLIAVLVIVYGFFIQSLINSRKAALEETQRTQKQLAQSEKLAALGAVAAGVAHEVKNPLAIIVQGVEFLKMALRDNARLLDVTERIEKSALRADNIVKGLLSYSREIALKMEETDIEPVIDEALTFVDHQLRQKRINVKKQYAPGLPKIIMDGDQIKQVFTNLFTNAIEAMPGGGILGIRTEQAGGGNGQASVTVVVSDTGEGIPEDRIRRIFDPFFTTKESERNTGLGLSITKGIIDKHRGTIEIESEPGRGTRIVIGLPAGLV
ncbi:MAG TPA: ATP-binding protein [Syntrophales bacterium]|nr:ATP-binding protein [Syntrophales bacterium]